MHSEGHDEGSHAVSRKDSHGDADLKQGKPHGLFILPIFVNPDRVVDQQKDLADSSGKPAQIGGDFLAAHNEQSQRYLQQDECDKGENLRIKMLIQSACEDAHDGNSQVYNTAQDAELGFIHAEVIDQLRGAGGEDAVVEVDEDVGQDH